MLDTEILEYFNNDDLAATVFSEKYALPGEKTPTDTFNRLACEFFRIEQSKFKEPLSRDEIFNLFDKFKYLVPGGSVLFGVGNNTQIISLSNCYVTESPLDSYSSIIKTDGQIVNIAKRRGGVGLCLDNLRPNNFPTRNAARTSTGIIPFMERYSNSIKEVGQAGRRGAALMLLSVHHPQILDFINSKIEDNKISGANISVKLSNEFLTAVKNNTEYELRFPVDKDKPCQWRSKIMATTVWNAIIHAAWTRGEPGILFWDNIQSTGPADCYPEYRSVATNPCGEQPLSELDSCRLMSINLFSCVTNPFTTTAMIDYKLLYKVAYDSTRMMDNLVDLESEKVQGIIDKIKQDPEPDYIKNDELKLWETIKVHNDQGRRVGLGSMALADTFAALGIKYGSEESLKLAENIFRTIKLAAYRSSVDMAKELGSFVGYDSEKEKDNPYIIRIKEEDPELYADMIKYGRRNIALTTVAPTGSISILTKTTSGLEPLFNLSYTRRSKVTDNSEPDSIDKEGIKWKHFEVLHPKLQLWSNITGEKDPTKSPYYDSTADKIDWIQRVKLQGTIQKHICASISSTINLPNEIDVEIVSDIYNEAWKCNLKGITVYRDGCRAGVLVNNATDYTEHAPRRPKEIPCEIYHITVSKKLDKLRTFSYLVAIGILNNKPYEIFAMENGNYNKKSTIGSIIRVAKSKYTIKCDTGDIIENITGDTTDQEDSLTRMVSLALRHGVPINFIVEQLGKVQGEIFCFAKSIARSLKKYIKDGTKSSESCPNCDMKLVYENGCYVCRNCGFSKCA